MDYGLIEEGGEPQLTGPQIEELMRIVRVRPQLAMDIYEAITGQSSYDSSLPSIPQSPLREMD